MVAFLKLIVLGFVAVGTVQGCDDGGNKDSIVVEAVSVSLLGVMAVDTAHTLARVGAQFPVVDDARVSRRWWQSTHCIELAGTTM